MVGITFAFMTDDTYAITEIWSSQGNPSGLLLGYPQVYTLVHTFLGCAQKSYPYILDVM